MSLAVPLTHLTELSAVEACLVADLAGRDHGWAAEPSGLPGWSRAHVVAHLVGSADGLKNLAGWAASGVETPMYPNADARSADIERRAAMPWDDLVGEVSATATRLRQALDALTEPVLARHLRLGSGAAVSVVDLAAVRIREIEIHRVDLAAEYQPIDWSAPFTVRTFGQLTPFFRSQREVGAQTLRSIDSGNCWTVGEHGPDLIGTEADLLGWLIGRSHGPLRTSDGSAVPPAPTWV
jgi:maleylpyruvate isomerase